jgi:hypothetical protein
MEPTTNWLRIIPAGIIITGFPAIVITASIEAHSWDGRTFQFVPALRSSGQNHDLGPRIRRSGK